jgi:hypothetical protein
MNVWLRRQSGVESTVIHVQAQLLIFCYLSRVRMFFLLDYLFAD